MATTIECRRISHPNVVIEDMAATLALWTDLFGGSHMFKLPSGNWHAELIEVGGLVFELFAPLHFMLHSRIGPHYLGVEYETPDVDVARQACADHDVRIMRDIVEAFHTDPMTSLGVDYEFYAGTFYGPDAPHVTTKSKPAAYWRDHPIGYSGWLGYTHAVVDIDAASRFIQSFLGAKPIYEADRPNLGARAIGFQVADDVCELITPVADGILRTEMMATGHGIRSTVYGVQDIAKARAWFDGKGVRLIDGTAPGSFAVDPRDNAGILFEFAQKG